MPKLQVSQISNTASAINEFQVVFKNRIRGKAHVFIEVNFELKNKIAIEIIDDSKKGVSTVFFKDKGLCVKNKLVDFSISSIPVNSGQNIIMNVEKLSRWNIISLPKELDFSKSIFGVLLESIDWT